MLTLLHAYKGLGRQRVALQEAIVPPQRTGGPPFATVDYDEYESKWEIWRSLISLAKQFNVALPDPSFIFQFYKMSLLGGESQFGVLTQFPQLRFKMEHMEASEDTVNLRAGHTVRALALIAAFHEKVIAHLKVASPTTGKPKKQKKDKSDAEDFNKFDGKGPKGGGGGQQAPNAKKDGQQQGRPAC